MVRKTFCEQREIHYVRLCHSGLETEMPGREKVCRKSTNQYNKIYYQPCQRGVLRSSQSVFFVRKNSSNKYLCSNESQFQKNVCSYHQGSQQ